MSIFVRTILNVKMRVKINSWYLRLVTLSILVIISAHNSFAQCVKSSPCTCIHEDGAGYDLTSLMNEKFFSTRNNTVRFHPCKDVNLTFEESPSSQSECVSTSMCMRNEKNESINLGTVADSSWEFKDNNAQLVFRHTASDKTVHETEIILNGCHLCEHSHLIFDSASGTTNKLVLILSKPCLLSATPKSLSTGSVLVILFCVFSTVYFVGGALFLKLLKGAVGLELIPNYDFWSELPGLVKDGVAFTFKSCTTVSYDSI